MSKELNNLIAKCKSGNESAMMQLYDRYCDAMFNIANRYLCEEDAKDAMQEGFLKVFTNLESFEPRSTFGAWLKRIIINQCMDALKKRQLQFTEMEEASISVLDPEDWTVEPTITKHEVLLAIQKLPQKYKVVVQLYVIEGYDHEEISEILDIPIKTSRTQLRRGRLQLQEQLKTKYHETGY